MSRFLGAAFAAALLLAPAGCLPAFLTLSPGPGGHKLVVPGRPAQVARLLEAGLIDAGHHVLSNRIDGEIRLAGQTRNGNIFCIYLRDQKAEGVERTSFTLRWDRGGPDEEFWRDVQELLAAIEGDGDTAVGH